MTDTTDIKALSYARLIEVRNILSDLEDGYDTVADKENYEAMRDAQALINELISSRWSLVTVTTKLEAERQRVDHNKVMQLAAEDVSASALRDWSSEGIKLHAANEEIKRLTAEISVLKGDQVPVGKFVFEPSGERWHHIKHGEHQHTEPKLKLVKLFTAPQKPVVLPHGHKPYLVRSQTTAPRAAMTANGDWLHRVQVIEAIEAAGGIVKDGE